MMKKFRFTSGLTIGLIVGALLMISSSSFAALEEKIEAYFGQYTIQVNGEVADLEDSKIIVKEGTTYLPVRKLANILGYDVTYLADSRTIVLNNQAADKTDTPDMKQDVSDISNDQMSENKVITDDGYVELLSLDYDHFEVMLGAHEVILNTDDGRIRIPIGNAEDIKENVEEFSIDGKTIRFKRVGDYLYVHLVDLRQFVHIPEE